MEQMIQYEDPFELSELFITNDNTNSIVNYLFKNDYHYFRLFHSLFNIQFIIKFQMNKYNLKYPF
jgi:hypothetical protein